MTGRIISLNNYRISDTSEHMLGKVKTSGESFQCITKVIVIIN